MISKTPLGRHRAGALALLASVALLSTAVDPALAGPRIVDDGAEAPPPPEPPPGVEPDPERRAPTTDASGRPTEPAPSRPDRPPPGTHTHDGFHFRLLAGGDIWFVSQDDFGVDVSVTAVGVPILTGGLELGYTLWNNVTGFVEVMFNGGPVLEAKVDDHTFTDEGSFWGFGLGLGASIYLMPENVYIAGSAGTAGISFSDDEGGGGSGSSENGFYVAGKLGIEWWMTTNWGLGAATRVVYMNLPDDSTTIHNIGVGLFLSATYN